MDGMPVGIPSGWEWMAAHGDDFDLWDGYLVNSELLEWGGGDWRIESCDTW